MSLIDLAWNARSESLAEQYHLRDTHLAACLQTQDHILTQHISEVRRMYWNIRFVMWLFCLLKAESKMDMAQHIQQLNSDLINANRETQREIYQQRNEQFQTVIGNLSKFSGLRFN